MATRPVFVVGMGRSGTTLLRSLISMHPALQLAPETHFLSYWMRRFRGVDLSRSEEFDAFWAALTGHELFGNLELDAAEVRRRIGANPTFKSVFEALLVSYSSSRGKPGWGEKTPNHFQHIDQLLEWYPQARIVFSIRDPRGVVASWQRLDRPWTRRTITEIAVSWRESVYEADRWAKDHRVMVVRYEDLLRGGSAELRPVFDFLEVDFPAAEFAARDQDPARSRPNPDGELALEAVDRWRETLTPDQVAAAERHIRYEMLRWGYEPSSSVSALAGVPAAARRRLYFLRRKWRTIRPKPALPPA